MQKLLTAEQQDQPVNVTLPLKALLRLAEREERLRYVNPATDTPGLRVAFHQDVAPAIGEAYEAGIYAGLTLHDGLPMALVLLPGEINDCTHAQANAWAGVKGGVLPSRIDALVLWQRFGKNKAEFKDQAYWTAEQDAGAAAYAWCQSFYHGGQYYGSLDTKLRARAVRRVPI